MEAFALIPPGWTAAAVHALQFCCPTCGAAGGAAQAVWINRRAPVYTHHHQRKWQEFYHCECGTAWWAWSSDRPPNPWREPEPSSDWPREDLDPPVTPSDFPGADIP
jgi:hypothetical protein